MKILHKYVIKQVLGVFFMCLIVFTFVLFIGNMLRIIEMMSKGIAISVIFKFLILLLPFMLAYSIPMSLLTAVLLVFARLSADNEITAIRANGINLKYIFRPVLICTIFMVPLCYFINNDLRPNSIFTGRKLLLQVGIQEPMFNLESGRFNEVFPNYVIYVGQKQGKIYKKVVVYVFEKDQLTNVITAESGQFSHGDNNSKNNGNIIFRLFNGVIEEIPQKDKETGKLNRIQFETYSIEFNLNEQIEDVSQLSKKEREMTNLELLNRIKNLKKDLDKQEYKPLIIKLEREVSSIRTRIHNRLALSFSCFVFVLVAIPLGIKVHRSETSISIGISLVFVCSYYFLMTLGEVFQEKTALHPWLLMWIPDLVLFSIGMALLYKLSKK